MVIIFGSARYVCMVAHADEPVPRRLRTRDPDPYACRGYRSTACVKGKLELGQGQRSVGTVFPEHVLGPGASVNQKCGGTGLSL